MVNMSTQSFINSELLCFVQNNLSNCAHQSLVSSIGGFFTVDEIAKAKDLLFEVAERCKATLSSLDLPRNKSKLAKDGRAKAYANDILSLWEILDTAKATLPLFGAVNMKRYPPVTLSDSNMCGLTVNVLDVQSHITEFKSHLVTIVQQLKSMEAGQRVLAERMGGVGTMNQSAPVHGVHPSASASASASMKDHIVNPVAQPSQAGGTSYASALCRQPRCTRWQTSTASRW